jgi:1,5-anhydro-D-fructose reductase (1,5-anhydro-D-mannitol-forming)
MDPVRWGILGCGAVCEVKSGPALQNAAGSALVAVMRRDRAKAEDFAARHGVPRVHSTAEALIEDPEVDVVYIATPPESHASLALRVAAAGKPCLVEKPMARDHTESLRMVEAFRAAGQPLWVAYYRRALPRFLLVQELLSTGAIGRLTSVHVRITHQLAAPDVLGNWRFVPEVSGGGLFFDLASHCFDLIDFLVGPVRGVAGFAANTAGAYAAEDVTAAVFGFDTGAAGTGVWNFNAWQKTDALSFIGTAGEISTAVFADEDVVVTSRSSRRVHDMRNPPHVHQPLVQTIVDELRGRGTCPSTGESAARTSLALDACVAGYYQGRH